MTNINLDPSVTGTNLDYDYAECDCEKLSMRALRKLLREKLELHADCHNLYLVEMPWHDEELCPPIYSKEDIEEIERQQKWHSAMCDRIESLIKEI